MNLTVEQLEQYSFCPKFYEQDGKFSGLDISNSLFKDLVTYLFRRDMETSSKQDWKQLEKRWKKIFFSKFAVDDDTIALFNSSLVPLFNFHKWYLKQSVNTLGVNHSFNSFLYGHHMECEIPVMLHTNEGSIEMICVTDSASVYRVFYDPSIRYSSVILFEEHNEFNVTKISNISLLNFKVFIDESFIPSQRYWESAMSDMVHLTQAIGQGLFYPNTSSCSVCTLRKTCEVMKGNE